MKRIFYAAAIAAVAATSCTKSDVVDVHQEGISFNAYTSGVTKATSWTTTSVSDTAFPGFKIDAYKSTGAYPTSATEYFVDKTLKFNGFKWNMSDGAIYFWPTEETETLSFFSTNATEANGDLVELKDGTSAYPSFDYTVKDVAGMEDILAANTMNQTDADERVNLNFEHILSKINFKFRGSADGGQVTKDDGSVETIDYTYTIKQIEVAGLADGGTFTFNGAASGTVPGAWSGQAVSATAPIYSYDFTGLTDYVKNTEVLPLIKSDNSNSLMVLPQAATGTTMSIRVQFTVTYNDGVNNVVIYPLDAGNIPYDYGTSVTTYLDAVLKTDFVKSDSELNTGEAQTGWQKMEITLADASFNLNPRSSTLFTLVLPSPGDILTYDVTVNDWDADVEYGVQDNDVFEKIEEVNGLITTVTYKNASGLKSTETVTTLDAATETYTEKLVETIYDTTNNDNYVETTTNYSAQDVMTDETYEEYENSAVVYTRTTTVDTTNTTVKIVDDRKTPIKVTTTIVKETATDAFVSKEVETKDSTTGNDYYYSITKVTYTDFDTVGTTEIKYYDNSGNEVDENGTKK